MADMPGRNGFIRDPANSRLSIYVNGTEIYRFTTTVAANLGSGTQTFAAGITITAGDLTATAGNLVVTLGDLRLTSGNSRHGAATAFATTQPISAAVFKVGTAPAGAIVTSGAIFTDGVTVKKIIADGTVSDVQT